MDNKHLLTHSKNVGYYQHPPRVIKDENPYMATNDTHVAADNSSIVASSNTKQLANNSSPRSFTRRNSQRSQMPTTTQYPWKYDVALKQELSNNITAARSERFLSLSRADNYENASDGVSDKEANVLNSNQDANDSGCNSNVGQGLYLEVAPPQQQPTTCERDDGYESPGTFSSDVTSSTSGHMYINEPIEASRASNNLYEEDGLTSSQKPENGNRNMSYEQFPLRPETLPGLDCYYTQNICNRDNSSCTYAHYGIQSQLSPYGNDGHVKTRLGYVDINRIPSFKFMNSCLRNKLKAPTNVKDNLNPQLSVSKIDDPTGNTLEQRIKNIVIDDSVNSDFENTLLSVGCDNDNQFQTYAADCNNTNKLFINNNTAQSATNTIPKELLRHQSFNSNSHGRNSDPLNKASKHHPNGGVMRSNSLHKLGYLDNMGSKCYSQYDFQDLTNDQNFKNHSISPSYKNIHSDYMADRKHIQTGCSVTGADKYSISNTPNCKTGSEINTHVKEERQYYSDKVHDIGVSKIGLSNQGIDSISNKSDSNIMAAELYNMYPCNKRNTGRMNSCFDNHTAANATTSTPVYQHQSYYTTESDHSVNTVNRDKHESQCSISNQLITDIDHCSKAQYDCTQLGNQFNIKVGNTSETLAEKYPFANNYSNMMQVPLVKQVPRKCGGNDFVKHTDHSSSDRHQQPHFTREQKVTAQMINNEALLSHIGSYQVYSPIQISQDKDSSVHKLKSDIPNEDRSVPVNKPVHATHYSKHNKEQTSVLSLSKSMPNIYSTDVTERKGSDCSSILSNKKVHFKVDEHGNTKHTTHYINKDTGSPMDVPHHNVNPDNTGDKQIPTIVTPTGEYMQPARAQLVISQTRTLPVTSIEPEDVTYHQRDMVKFHGNHPHEEGNTSNYGHNVRFTAERTLSENKLPFTMDLFKPTLPYTQNIPNEVHSNSDNHSVIIHSDASTYYEPVHSPPYRDSMLQHSQHSLGHITDNNYDIRHLNITGDESFNMESASNDDNNVNYRSKNDVGLDIVEHVTKRKLGPNSNVQNAHQDEFDDCQCDQTKVHNINRDQITRIKTSISDNNIKEWLKLSSNTYKYNTLTHEFEGSRGATGYRAETDNVNSATGSNLTVMSTKQRLWELRQAKGPVYARTSEIYQLLAANRGNPLALNSPYYKHFAESSL